MSDRLLMFWIALIGADRIDLLGGRGPVVLTPFLAVTPIVVLVEARRRLHTARPVTVSPYLVGYAAVAAALFCTVLLSVLGAPELRVSASRAFLLIADVVGTLAVTVMVADRKDLLRVFARGATLGVAIFLAFDVAELLYWIGRGVELVRIGPVLISLSDFGSLGSVPRLAGPVGDANRAGFLLLFYTTIVALGEHRRGLRQVTVGLCVVMLLATLSRSSMLGGAATLATALLSRRVRVGPAPFAAASLAVAAVAVVLMAKPNVLGNGTDILSSPVYQHLTVGEGSAKGHVELIRRGIQEATHSVSRATIGLGYGNAFAALRDVFPGNKYGNFHSLYITIFAESGVFALLLMLVLLLTPLLTGGVWLPLVVGAVCFNTFYQALAEPAFWLLLALAWAAIPVHRRVVRAPAGGETSLLEFPR